MNKIKAFFTETDFGEYWDEVKLFAYYLGLFAVGCVVIALMYWAAAIVAVIGAGVFGYVVFEDWQSARDTR